MNKLHRMKLLATGLLVFAGAVYVAARALEPGRPWLHYVAAAAEAAMIGAIADWFAVVALFPQSGNGVLVTANAAESMGGDHATSEAIHALAATIAEPAH